MLNMGRYSLQNLFAPAIAPESPRLPRETQREIERISDALLRALESVGKAYAGVGVGALKIVLPKIKEIGTDTPSDRHDYTIARLFERRVHVLYQQTRLSKRNEDWILRVSLTDVHFPNMSLMDFVAKTEVDTDLENLYNGCVSASATLFGLAHDYTAYSLPREVQALARSHGISPITEAIEPYLIERLSRQAEASLSGLDGIDWKVNSKKFKMWRFVRSRSGSRTQRLSRGSSGDEVLTTHK